jgi:hypothetical protein
MFTARDNSYRQFTAVKYDHSMFSKCGTVVEGLPLHPRVDGSSPGTGSGTIGEKGVP